MRSVVKVVILAAVVLSAAYFLNAFRQNMILSKIIERLTSESRVAEVIVSDVRNDYHTGKSYTTIKFLEYDTRGEPLSPKYFTFSSNILQFQSLVIRFDDFYVKKGDRLKGKSAYLFMKVFALKDKGAEVYEINRANEVPSGYRSGKRVSGFEEKLWRRFWEYALKPQEAKRMGIKNVQIEAPGTKFIPGMLYTLKIEHDGGLRVDGRPLPRILEGEKTAVPRADL